MDLLVLFFVGGVEYGCDDLGFDVVVLEVFFGQFNGRGQYRGLVDFQWMYFLIGIGDYYDVCYEFLIQFLWKCLYGSEVVFDFQVVDVVLVFCFDVDLFG